MQPRTVSSLRFPSIVSTLVTTFRLKSGHSGKDCKCKMSAEDHEKLMTKVNNWLAWDKVSNVM